MEKQSEVWRRIGGKAISCTDCDFNKGRVVTNETPVGIEYDCTAKDGICVFMNCKPDNDKWYSNFRDAYNDNQEAAE